MDIGVPSGDIVNFSFLCPEGGRRALTSFPCVWSAKPWNAYMTRKSTAMCASHSLSFLFYSYFILIVSLSFFILGSFSLSVPL